MRKADAARKQLRLLRNAVCAACTSTTQPNQQTGRCGDARRRRSARVDPRPKSTLFGIDTTVVRLDGGIYFVPTYAAHRPVARRVLNGRYVSPPLHNLVAEVMRRRPGSMIHAGTFFGDMLVSFARRTTGTVYAFEPVIENYLLALSVLQANNLTNVMLIHAGLGTDRTIAQVQTHGPGRAHYGGAARIMRDPAKKTFRPQQVALLSIDQFGFDDLSLIQLDIEGFELEALRGAARTIAAQHPVIVVEDNRGNCAQFLAEFGYRETARAGRDHVYMTQSGIDEIGDLSALPRRVPRHRPRDG
jgi:FkbM family methyltransferase